MARQKLPTTHYDALSGTACRAVYTRELGMMHNVEFTFKTEQGDVVITMPFSVARETLNTGIAAYEAIMQPLQIARNVPFGG